MNLVIIYSNQMTIMNTGFLTINNIDMELGVDIFSTVIW